MLYMAYNGRRKSMNDYLLTVVETINVSSIDDANDYLNHGYKLLEVTHSLRADDKATFPVWTLGRSSDIKQYDPHALAKAIYAASTKIRSKE